MKLKNTILALLAVTFLNAKAVTLDQLLGVINRQPAINILNNVVAPAIAMSIGDAILLLDSPINNIYINDALAIKGFTISSLKNQYAEKNFNQAKQLIKSESRPAAIVSLTNAIKFAPANPVYWEERGLIFLELCDYLKAANDFTMAIRFAPSDAELYSELALAYFALGNYTAAFNNFLTAANLGHADARHIIRHNPRARARAIRAYALNTFGLIL